MRTIGAAIPLAIALLGVSNIGPGTEVTGTRMRLASNAKTTDIVAAASLNDDELTWLSEQNPFGIPQIQTPGNRTLVVREGYSMAHDNVDLVANWVAFHLTKKYAEGSEKRPSSSYFKPDPLLPVGHRAELADYKGWKNIYDRGHQCASGDSKGRGTRVIRESFYLSNMTPQNSKLNQQKWKVLEGKIQHLAETRGELWVTTGPAWVDEDGDGLVEYSVIGKDEVAVPTHYYKIVLARAEDGSGDLEAMAFLIPNEPMEGSYSDYLRSIDEIEELTGIDFFEKLPDAQEDELEAGTVEEVWTE